MATMTEREFLKAIINANGIADDVKEYAIAGIAKLDAKNEKRRTTLDKNQIANEDIIKDIIALLGEKPMVASEIATALGVSTQKASALCSKIVERGLATVSERKEKGKSAVKEYALVTE